MYLTAHPFLLYILIIYSIFILIRSKTKNEFLLLFTIFLFLEAKNSWENSIVSIITTPINIRVIDVPLLMLIFYIIKATKKNNVFNDIFIVSKILFIFLIVVISYTLWGLLQFGHAGIAEFRLLFFYIIVVLFIFSNVKYYEILRLIKKTAEYLMPLILLIPINILLTGNVKISENNRALGAFTYETITLGYIAGYFYWTYVDRKFKFFKRLLPIFLISSIWANVRTVWAIIIAAIIFKLLFEKGKAKTIVYLSIFIVIISASSSINIDYIGERTKAFTNINEDTTGRWRLYIWSSVIHNATLLGEGIGARFNVYVDALGFEVKYGAHNGFIRILYNLGYLGVFIIIALFISFIVKFLNLIKKSSFLSIDNMIYKLSIMSVISLVLYMIGYGPDLMSWIFIAFGLKYTLQKKDKNLVNYRSPLA